MHHVKPSSTQQLLLGSGLVIWLTGDVGALARHGSDYSKHVTASGHRLHAAAGVWPHDGLDGCAGSSGETRLPNLEQVTWAPLAGRDRDDMRLAERGQQPAAASRGQGRRLTAFSACSQMAYGHVLRRFPNLAQLEFVGFGAGMLAY